MSAAGSSAIDFGPLIETVSIIAITIVCLVLDLVALIATQAKNPQIRFAIMAGAFSLSTGLICFTWTVILLDGWLPLILFASLAMIFGSLTIAAGFYMRSKIVADK